MVSPKVEAQASNVQAAFHQGRVIHQPLDREHFAERVGDRGSRRQHKRPARVLRFDEASVNLRLKLGLTH